MQKATLDSQKATLDSQKATLASQKATLASQKATLDSQKATLDSRNVLLRLGNGQKERPAVCLGQATGLIDHLKAANILAKFT